ncbi:MAG TPA: molybdopterin-binding protein, partial [Candidatus Omnitrophota bacterium]|nr:molybdopterin-binding protein [Candidatus Omnitrophota bacterium]
IKRILKNFDVLILSGGVSMGKFDYVPQVLTKLGVKVLFHKVRQKPGKPFWFGVKKNGPAVFALPGNPASTLVCFYRYVLPQLKRSSGLSSMPQEFAVLSKDISTSSSLTHFLPVTINFHKNGQLKAQPVSSSGSGDYLALAKSDGFVELKEWQRHFAAKTVVPFYRW